MIIVKNRELLIPNNERYIGTTYDTETENRIFQVPRYSQRGVDLAALTFRLDIQYANESYDTIVLDKEVGEAFIILIWRITSSTLQVPGTMYIGIRAIDNEAAVKWSSFSAAMYVERHLNTPGNYGGGLTEIEQMEQDHQYMKGVVNELKANLDYAHDAEAWAQGTRSGTAVPSTDKTYQKNSKYYSEQANVSKNAAASSATAAAGSATQAAATVADTNTRFNNAVAAVTSDTEVIDARVGADGTQYTVLKNRLDAEHSSVKNAIQAQTKLTLTNDFETKVITGAQINNEGVITSSSNASLYYACVVGVDSITLNNSVVGFYGFYSTTPAIGAVSTNGSRTSASAGSTVINVSGVDWIAFHSQGTASFTLNDNTVLDKAKAYTDAALNQAKTYTDAELSEAINGINATIDAIEAPDPRSVASVYKAEVHNPTEYAYTNAVIEIRVNFDPGVCKDKDYIRITNESGTEIPFSLCPCKDENVFVDKDYTYHNDHSIHCASLLIIDSIAASGSNTYTVTIGTEKHQAYVENVTSMVTGTGYPRLVANKVTLNFDKDSHYRLIGVLTANKNYFPDLNYGIIVNGTGIKESNAAFESYLNGYSYEFEGDGIVYRDLVRTLTFTGYTVKQRYRLYSNNRFDVFTCVAFTSDHTGETRHYVRMELPTGATISEEDANGATRYHWTDSANSVDMGISVLYCNGNSQRDDTSLPIYKSVYVINATGTTNFLMTIGQETQNTLTWEKGFAFTSLFTWVYDTKANDVYRIYNNLISIAADTRANIEKAKMQNLMKPYMFGLSDIFLKDHDALIAIRNMKPYCDYAKYLNNYISFSDVETSFKTMMSEVYGGTDEAAINRGYETYGLNYMGRSLPVSYHLYKKTGDTYYSTVIKSYADFIVSLYNEYGDIPATQSQTSGSTNSRAVAMLALGMAINIGLDQNSTYAGVFAAIDNLNAQDGVVGTIIPEGNIITNRYLHYTAFANYYIFLAYKLANMTGWMKSRHNYMFDACHPSGELKELTYLCSESRRGLLHTYSYVLGTLALSDDSCAMKQASEALLWASKQIPAVGGMPAQADGYDTYPISQDAFTFNMGFAVAVLVDLCVLE